jgi:aminomethyltransferase
VLRGLVALDRGIPRPHMPVRDAAAATVGEVTSGTFSPSRRVGIALALLSPAVSEDDEVVVDVRGRPCATRVVKPPFVDRSPQA